MLTLPRSQAYQKGHCEIDSPLPFWLKPFYFSDPAQWLLVSENALSILYGSGALLQVLICGSSDEKHIRVTGTLLIE